MRGIVWSFLVLAGEMTGKHEKVVVCCGIGFAVRAVEEVGEMVGGHS